MRLRSNYPGLASFPTPVIAPPFVPPVSPGPFMSLDLYTPSRPRLYPTIDYQVDLSLLVPSAPITYFIAAGHYAQTSNFHGDAGAFTAATSFYNSNVKPNPTVKGFEKYCYLADCDAGTTGPNFTAFVSRVSALLTTIAANNDFLGLGFYDHSFTTSPNGVIPTNGGGVVPQYFVTNGWAACGGTNELWDVGAALWEPTGGVVSWWKAMIDALSVFDGHPALAWISMPWVESTTNNSGNNRGGQGPAFTGTAMLSAALQVCTYFRQKFKKTLGRVGLNYISDNTANSAMSTFMQELSALTGFIVGSTDPEGSISASFPTGNFTRFINANQVFCGRDSPTSGQKYPDLRGTMLWASEVQQIGWNYNNGGNPTNSTMTPAQLFAQNQGVMGATNCFQCYQVENGALTASQTWSSGILPFIQSIGGATAQGIPTGGGGYIVR